MISGSEIHGSFKAAIAANFFKICRIPEVNAGVKQELGKEEPKQPVYQFTNVPITTRNTALKTNENSIIVFENTKTLR